MRLTIERIDDLAAMSRLVPEWEALESELSPRTPFTSPHWISAWWQHFAEDRLAIRDELYAHALRNEDGTLVGIAPMVITHRPSIGPVRTRKLQFVGADANVTELRGLICRPEDEQRVLSALVQHLDAEDTWDWCELSGLRVQSMENLSGMFDARRFSKSGEALDYYLPLVENWEAFRSSRPRNIKESLRKCYNSLKRDGHAFELRVVTEPDQIPAALECFKKLHGMRASATDTIDHRDVFAAPRAAAFLASFTQGAAQRGIARIFQLVIGGEVVATRIGFVLGSELYLYFSGYDLAWSKYSVMTTLVAEAIRWAFAEDLRLVNLSPGTDVSKTRWAPEVAVFANGVLSARRLRGRLAESSYNELLRRVQQDGLLRRVAARVKRVR